MPELEVAMQQMPYDEFKEEMAQSLRGRLQRIEDFRNKIGTDKKRLDKLVGQGLFYSAKIDMPALFDKECRKPSRCYITKILIDFGANPNV